MELQFFKTDRIEDKLDKLVKVAWELLQWKIAGGLVKVNKEASLQLHYAYILQELISICQFSDNENVKVVLERTIAMGDKSTQEIDVVIETTANDAPYQVAIEMKCYRKFASSGGYRGAMDVFAKCVYEDIESLEKYSAVDDKIKKRFFLVMTDHENFVYPKNKDAKYWAYDFSDGFVLEGPKDIDVPIGGEDVYVHIGGRYTFDWTSVPSPTGFFYFLILEV